MVGPLPLEHDPSTPLQLAAAHHVTDVEFARALPDSTTDTGHTYGVAVLGADGPAALVAAHGAVVECALIGGLSVTWQVTARLQLSLYADTWDNAWAAQQKLEAHLAGRWQPTNGPRRIDSWRNESAAVQVPYPDELIVLASIWRITTRDLPE
ncbi:hypothetical protein [Nocardioides bruguierae]|uniref:Uncharacterized protein n=1 Tax=Nocardioides bruguierae TaxID=2945102 RepID=A0A9X2II70_9ACTN|nr:hypothetical protein [Nocardioides bruguierae]MCM0622510.1 hypothetical protein [Nocardioides bruguierae]